MINKGEQAVVFFIRMKLDQVKLNQLDFEDFIDYIEVDSEIVSIYHDDENNTMVLLGHKTPMIDKDKYYIGRDSTSFVLDSLEDLLMIGKQEVNENLSYVNFVIWGKKDKKDSMKFKINQFIDSQEHNMRKQVMLRG
jgi:hypothetical protein